MYKEYIEFYQTYTQKYGPRTAIFLMVGSFYELYDIQNKETGETKCNVREIVDYLGIQLSTKKGDFSEEEEGLFAGFPDYVMHKWAGRLTSAGWTVVIVDQHKDMKGKVKERKVSRILSPSTHIENVASTETPYILTLYFHRLSGSTPVFGAGLLDLTTGTTTTYSGATTGTYEIWTADDLTQLMSVFQPKEVLIYWKGYAPMDLAFFRRQFGISPLVPVHFREVETHGAFDKELVRAEYFQRIYSIQSLLPPRTYLGLRSEIEEFALLYLLQFIEEHYPTMLRSFHRNQPWIPQSRLICGNHALTQLQMTGSNPQETVVGLFDKCITPMGKRSIKERLLSPYSNAREISMRLTEVSRYMEWSDEKTRILEKQLRFMYDLPRLHRKMLCGMITASEIVGLFQTYRAMHEIMIHVTAETCLQEPFSIEEWNSYQETMSTHFSEEKARRASSEVTPFHSDTYPEISKKEAEMEQFRMELDQIRREIAQKGNVAEETLRVEEKEKEPFGFKASSITLQQLKKRLHELPPGTRLQELKSGGWIECPLLQQLNTKMLKAREELDRLVQRDLPDACLAITHAGRELWHLMESWICHIDNTQCIGRVSKERGYVCPTIINDDEKGSKEAKEAKDEEGSYVHIQKMRHPLVESSATRISYVKHDVSLGKGTNGWLVYGMNASGKSTLMKATGICILLAQAGCFVPALQMTLRPFQAIYTRILNQDNLFAGLSSFAVEMSELRDILRNATPHTLVLGDELCSGTESISAQALVGSGIQWLSKHRSKFIFATHLHDLPRQVDLKKEKVSVWHLHVEYDPITKKLIYDRSLRSGSGSTLYGLEVARAMDLPFEFIEKALENRHRIIGSTTQQDASTSAWNSQLVRKMCELCRHSITSELEVHHIEPRRLAKKGVLQDGSSMNDPRNLIVLCKTCHDQIHSSDETVESVDLSLQMTSNGPERMIRSPGESSKNKKHGKWSEEEIEQIQAVLKKYHTQSLKSIRGLLSSTYGIAVSESVLSRMRKGE
jgi:DNA mismatch repair protein MutS